ncbi:MAG: hypothetical protein J1F28_02795 [Oscillospiraceae bacterium]|nr:hypothetical protein [Oscillospiraceae bacterium]
MFETETVILSGDEIEVDDLDGFHTVVHNLGEDAIYASKKPHIKHGAKNVWKIPPGAAKLISTTNGKVYLLGTGEVELTGQDHQVINISSSPSSNVMYVDGASGVTKKYVDEQISEVNNCITVLQDDKADKSEISNLNLLDNWYFTDPINQRGASGTVSDMGYFIDRWKLTDGTVEITSGGLVLNGTIVQRLETTPSQAVTATYLTSSGVQSAEYDSDAKTFSISGNGVLVIATKLEIGGRQTLAHQDDIGKWVLNDPPPNKTLELMKCQRYFIALKQYEVFKGANVRTGDYIDFFVPTPVQMRAIPAVSGNIVATANSEIVWEYSCVVNGASMIRIRASHENHNIPSDLAVDFELREGGAFLDANI